MDRFRRVAQLWNWLPGFRGVAEHHSIHQAAKALAVSASALSRTVRLLEAALGVELFIRRADGLELTPHGVELLAVTRDAMRQVDECIAREASRRGGRGPLHVSATTPLTASLLAQALTELDLGSGSVVRVTRLAPDAVEEALLQGNTDVVITQQPSLGSGLRRDHLGHAGHGLYATSAAIGELESRSLAALIDGPDPATATTAWNIVAWCESVATVRTLCERAPIVGVLPDIAARATALHRVGDLGEPAAVFALRRTTLALADADERVDGLLTRLRALAIAAA